MKNRLTVTLTVILAFLTLLPVALAEIKQVDLESEVMAIQNEVVGQELTGPIAKLFGDEKINVHLSTASGEESIIGIITEDKKVKALGLNEVSDASLDVYTDEKTAARILIAQNPAAQLQKALGEKKITYKAKGFFHRMKLGFVDMFVDVLKGAETGATEEEFEVEIVKALPIVAKEEKKEEPKEEEETPSGNDLTGNTVVDVQPKGNIWEVQLTGYGFEPEIVTLEAGDTIKFTNVRSGSLKNSQLIGTQACRALKSSKLVPGDTFEWTFDKPLKCFITDVFMTTKAVRVLVE
ncbi:hypothetical protein HYT55_03805 [Candidatus Woesearchaeota archaeon]|nr:hypothetical protein [Candidatus Woesearchaeota archaeon]